MKNSFIIFFSLLSSLFFAQSKNDLVLRDSLNKIINGRFHDTLKAAAKAELAGIIKYSEPAKADSLCRQALRSLNQNSQQREIGNSYKTLGVIHDGYGDSKESIAFYLKAIKYFNQCNDTMGVARTEGNIGVLYRQIGQSKEAMPYFRKSLSYFKRKNFVMGISIACQNIGIIFYDINQVDSALHYFLNAKKVLEENGMKDPALYGNISNCFDRKNDLPNQEKYLKMCLNAFEERQELSTQYYYWTFAFGTMLKDKGELKEALKYEQKGVEGYERLKTIQSRTGLVMLSSISDLYEKNGKYPEAIKTLRQAYSTLEKISKEDAIANMTEQKEKYESDKKELSIQNLEKEKRLQNAEITTKKNQQYALFGGLFLVCVFGVFMFNRYKVTEKQKSIIEDQKEVVEEQKKLVEEKQKEILDSIHYARRIQMALIPKDKRIEAMIERSKKQI